MKVQVRLLGGLTKVIDIDPRATWGATIGTNVFNADGTLWVPPTGGNGQMQITDWTLITSIPPNVVALANTATTGLYAITGAGTSATRQVVSSDSSVGVTNPGGVAGDVDLSVAHNNTTSKQGGTAGEYYHLTATQHGLIPASAGTLGQFLRGDGSWADTLFGPITVSHDPANGQLALFERTLPGESDVAIVSGGMGASGLSTDGAMIFRVGALDFTGGIEAGRFSLDGSFGVGTTNPNPFGAGVRVIKASVSGSAIVAAENTSVSPAVVCELGADPTPRGSIGTRSNHRLDVKVNDVDVATWSTAGDYFPNPDNARTLGSASNRWSVVYAATGTINTSDERDKTAVSSMTASEIAAAKAIAAEVGTYRWLDSVQEKGDAARKHVGLGVQRAISIMQSHGLDPFAYGFICHDEWEAETDAWVETPAVLDEDGKEVEPARRWLARAARPAGDRYGFRIEELSLFLARGFEARLSALESLASPSTP